MRSSGLTTCPLCRSDLIAAFDAAHVPLAATKGFATIDVCTNIACSLRGKDILNSQWVQEGEIDVVNTDASKCQSCLKPRTISKLRFRNCHFQLVMRVESSTGDKTWTTEDEFCAGVKDFRLKLDDQVLVMRASTTSSPKLRPPPSRAQGIQPRFTAATVDEHVFVDDDWLDHFRQLCRDLPPQTLREVKESLTPIISSMDKSILTTKTHQRREKWKSAAGEGYLVEMSQGPTMPPRVLQFPNDSDESMLILYWYTLQHPPVYQNVSQILNNPSLRYSSPEKVHAVMPFVKRLMEACQEVVTLQPDLSFGPANAWRGVAYRYSEEQWSKFQPENHISWYTVKSLSASPEVMEEFMGDAPHVTIFEVVDCTGVLIKPFSEYQNEDEVLLLPGSRFKVIEAVRSAKPGDAKVWNRADRVTLQMTA